jgi:hypothetical protein
MNDGQRKMNSGDNWTQMRKHCGILHVHQYRVIPAAACLMFLAAFSNVYGQVRLLDDFERFDGWRAITSEGAKLALHEAEGKTGKAMEMEFDLSKVSGYVIAQKNFDIELPANYEFTFDLRGETPVNNFEFKLIDGEGDVYWIKKLNIEFPQEWKRQRIRKRQITFAWGPHPDARLERVRKIEIVVSCGNGGKGRVFIDNFRYEAIDANAGRGAKARVTASGAATGMSPVIDSAGTLLTNWRSGGTSARESLTVDFDRRKEIGGLVIDWDSAAFAESYIVELSDDGKDWTNEYSVTNGNGGRDYIPLREGEGQFLRVVMSAPATGTMHGIRRMEIKDPRFADEPNDLFRSIAADAPPGFYPKYLQNRQSYWTVIGAQGDTKEALMNEQGQIEVDKSRFSLEPFLYYDGKLITWDNVTTTPELLDGYLPIPSVTWNYRNLWQIRIEAVAAGSPGKSLFCVMYSIWCNVPNGRAKFFVALRPFQVDPPWQALNTVGGAARIDSIRDKSGMIEVNDIPVIPMTRPDAFGAAEFDQGSVTDYLARGMIPPDHEVHDHFGYASAALEYDLSMESGQVASIVVGVPFHGWRKSPVPDMGGGGDKIYYDLMRAQTAGVWRQTLGTFNLQLPPVAGGVANTIRSTVAYILINRDGPRIQPGSRSYERSWIRDGSLTCSALLRLGHAQEVREFIDWYAGGQFPNGKIPCVMDERGPDAVPEHDSNGEFIYAILQYFRFTKDTLWLHGKWDEVVKTVRYIQSLRAQRKTDTYSNGTPEQRACFGLVPESISHEGYSDVPRHSYWDDFFILKGLKDATTIAGILGQRALRAEFAAERDDLRKDLYASMRLAMKNKNIDYIPGCVELGDFDPTSTTIGIVPCGELGNIPEPQLHRTFDKYFDFFEKRKTSDTYENYTPYETRIIGSFVALGEKKRAEEALNFFMHDRRPPQWNEWAEVVWRDPETPKYIGDMPHTWVGSDFVRSVLSMFVLERERDDAHVLAAGIPDSWVKDTSGIVMPAMQTYYGPVGLKISSRKNDVTVEVSGGFDARHHRLTLHSPLSQHPKSILVDGKKVRIGKSEEVLLSRLPAHVVFRY